MIEFELQNLKGFTKMFRTNRTQSAPNVSTNFYKISELEQNKKIKKNSEANIPTLFESKSFGTIINEAHEIKKNEAKIKNILSHSNYIKQKIKNNYNNNPETFKEFKKISVETIKNYINELLFNTNSLSSLKNKSSKILDLLITIINKINPKRKEENEEYLKEILKEEAMAINCPAGSFDITNNLIENKILIVLEIFQDIKVHRSKFGFGETASVKDIKSFLKEKKINCNYKIINSEIENLNTNFAHFNILKNNFKQNIKSYKSISEVNNNFKKYIKQKVKDSMLERAEYIINKDINNIKCIKNLFSNDNNSLTFVRQFETALKAEHSINNMLKWAINNKLDFNKCTTLQKKDFKGQIINFIIKNKNYLYTELNNESFNTFWAIIKKFEDDTKLIVIKNEIKDFFEVGSLIYS